MKKTRTGFERIVLFALCLALSVCLFSGCGAGIDYQESGNGQLQSELGGHAGEALETVQKYMDGLAGGDKSAMAKLIFVSDSEDTTPLRMANDFKRVFEDAFYVNETDSPLNAIIEKAKGYDGTLTYVGTAENSISRSGGDLCVQYEINVCCDQSYRQDRTIEFRVNFNMVKENDSWYIKNADAPTMEGDLDKFYGILDGKDFSDGVAWVEFCTGWGCIDTNGNILFKLSGEIPCTDFYNGIALVGSSEDAMRVIDKDGNEVRPNGNVEYDKIYASGYWSQIYRDGVWKPVSKQKYFHGIAFVEQVIDTYETAETRIGAFDASGNWIIEPTAEIQSVSYIGEQIYSIGNDRCFNAETGEFFDDPGYQILSKTELEFCNEDSARIKAIFENGLTVANDYESVEILDSSGNVTELPLEGSYAGPIGNGMFFFRDAFYNVNGEKVLDLSAFHFYEDGQVLHVGAGFLPYFVDGYCAVDIQNEAWSNFVTLIDTSGTMQFEPIHVLRHGMLSDGILWINTEDGYSYIDLSGNVLFSLPGDRCEFNNFQNGYGRVKIITNLATSDEFDIIYIDKNGQPAAWGY